MPDFIDKVHILHVQNKGLLPSECDKQFLDLACRLERYGMDFHQIIVRKTHKTFSLLQRIILCLSLLGFLWRSLVAGC